VIVVAEPGEAAGFGRRHAKVITTKDLYALVEKFGSTTASRLATSVPVAPRSGTLQLTTSGTTGEPKGVLLTAKQIAWTAEQVRSSHRLGPDDRGLCVLPFFHINAPVVSLCATLMAGSSLVIAPRFSLSRFWGWIEEERITWGSIVPTIVALLLSSEKPEFLPGPLRFLRTASAPLPVARHVGFEERFGIPLVETYGLSEAASQVTANPVPPGQRKVGSVGLPAGVGLRICASEPLQEPPAQGSGRSLVDMPPGEEGEICVQGPSVIAHYTGRRGASSFQDGWFRTGDLGYRGKEGYVYITGRLRDVINRGGEKVSPREIEEVLLASAQVRDAAVTSEPDPLYGQRIVAFIVVAEPYEVASEQELREHCLSHLSAYKVPETFYTLPILPRNGNGKLSRTALEAATVSTSEIEVADALVEQETRPGVMAHG
jgi:acyl-CoA synthetase (AMP-forming)/AMP-acid ligase II